MQPVNVGLGAVRACFSLVLALLILPMAAHAAFFTYYVDVLTEDAEDAGTDSPTYITLQGDKRSVRWELDNPGDDQQRGKWDSYKFRSDHDLGRIISVELQVTGDDGWSPRVVYVFGPKDPKFSGWRQESPRHADTGSNRFDYYRFDFRGVTIDTDHVSTAERALDEDGQAAYRKVASLSVPDVYFITVTTASSENAGTDNTVTLEAFGSRGSSFELRLDKPGHNDLETGAVDTYSLPHKGSLGRIEKIRLSIDGDDMWSGAEVEIFGPHDPEFPNWPVAIPGHAEAGGKSYNHYLYRPSDGAIRLSTDDRLAYPSVELTESRILTARQTDRDQKDRRDYETAKARLDDSHSTACDRHEAAELLIMMSPRYNNGRVDSKLFDVRDATRHPCFLEREADKAGKDEQPEPAPGPAGETYYVNVKTSKREHAETDDDVFITLYGDTGASLHTQLDNPGDDFRRDGWDYYRFTGIADLGRVTHVKLEVKGTDGWRPDVVYVLGPQDARYPHWRREGAGSLDASGSALDFYRFEFKDYDLRRGGTPSKLVGLDERGRQDLAKVSPQQMSYWTANSSKQLYLSRFRALAPSAGVGDAARVMGQIGGFALEQGIQATPYAGELFGDVVTSLISEAAGADDWGALGESVVDVVDGVTAGADDFYFKVNGQIVPTGGAGELAYSLDAGEYVLSDHSTPLDGLVKLELMEWDVFSDDSLGGMVFHPNMRQTGPEGAYAIIANKAARSIYEVRYHIVDCAVPQSGDVPDLAEFRRRTCG